MHLFTSCVLIHRAELANDPFGWVAPRGRNLRPISIPLSLLPWAIIHNAFHSHGIYMIIQLLIT